MTEERARIFVGTYCYLKNPKEVYNSCQVVTEGNIEDYSNKLDLENLTGLGREIGLLLNSKSIFIYDIFNGQKLKLRSGSLEHVPIGTIEPKKLEKLVEGIESGLKIEKIKPKSKIVKK